MFGGSQTLLPLVVLLIMIVPDAGIGMFIRPRIEHLNRAGRTKVKAIVRFILEDMEGVNRNKIENYPMKERLLMERPVHVVISGRGVDTVTCGLTFTDPCATLSHALNFLNNRHQNYIFTDYSITIDYKLTRIHPWLMSARMVIAASVSQLPLEVRFHGVNRPGWLQQLLDWVIGWEKESKQYGEGVSEWWVLGMGLSVTYSDLSRTSIILEEASGLYREPVSDKQTVNINNSNFGRLIVLRPIKEVHIDSCEINGATRPKETLIEVHNSTLFIWNSVITNNSAINGPVLVRSKNSNVTIFNTVVANNAYSHRYGLIYRDKKSFVIRKQCTYVNNRKIDDLYLHNRNNVTISDRNRGRRDGLILQPNQRVTIRNTGKRATVSVPTDGAQRNNRVDRRRRRRTIVRGSDLYFSSNGYVSLDSNLLLGTPRHHDDADVYLPVGTTVTVHSGVPTPLPSNPTCRIYSWRSMNCSWAQPGEWILPAGRSELVIEKVMGNPSAADQGHTSLILLVVSTSIVLIFCSGTCIFIRFRTKTRSMFKEQDGFFALKVTGNRAVLQGPRSDVKLEIPRGYYGSIKGYVHTDPTLFLGDIPMSECIVAPIVEYSTNLTLKYGDWFKISVPHCIRNQADLAHIRVRHGDVRKNKAFVKIPKGVSIDPSPYYYVSATHILIYTQSFSQFICTSCEKVCQAEAKAFVFGSLSPPWFKPVTAGVRLYLASLLYSIQDYNKDLVETEKNCRRTLLEQQSFRWEPETLDQQQFIYIGLHSPGWHPRPPPKLRQQYLNQTRVLVQRNPVTDMDSMLMCHACRSVPSHGAHFDLVVAEPDVGHPVALSGTLAMGLASRLILNLQFDMFSAEDKKPETNKHQLMLRKVTKRIIISEEDLTDFGLSLGYTIDEIDQMRTNHPISIQMAGLRLASEWWERSEEGVEEKGCALLGAVEDLGKLEQVEDVKRMLQGCQEATRRRERAALRGVDQSSARGLPQPEAMRRLPMLVEVPVITAGAAAPAINCAMQRVNMGEAFNQVAQANNLGDGNQACGDHVSGDTLVKGVAGGEPDDVSSTFLHSFTAYSCTVIAGVETG